MRLAARVLFYGVLSFMLAGLGACGPEKPAPSHPKEQGLIGTTCYATPVVKDPAGYNVCITPESNWPGMNRGEFWYVMGVSIVARQATVKSCEQANALDYGVRWGKSCYKACEEVVNCLGFTPNPEV